MSNVIPIEIKRSLNGQKNSIYPVIVFDDKEMILIDCGFAGYMELIEQEACKKGIDITKLTKIIITHQDIDHIGSLAAFKEKYPSVTIITSMEDVDYISGRKKHYRVELAEQNIEQLSEKEKTSVIENNKRLESFDKVKVDMGVCDNDKFDWCGGIEIIATPGHLPGHICVYFQEEKILVSGDAISIEDGKLADPNPVFTVDMDLARKSIYKLLNYDINKIITYHWGVFEGDVKKQIGEL